MAHHIGIDAGSKTIKVVVLDDAGEIVCSVYRRHRADIRTTLAEAMHDLAWRYGDIEGPIGITGSAGIALAKMLELPFYQEVVATTHAVRSAYPQADAVIELGGEDAKVVYLTGNLEQRMNATCAGGTGGFIDTIAFMIGTTSPQMSSLALSSTRTYPIASRCAVFAQNDVRPLLNAGARPADIAASALDAVVRQTLGGLACGRPIEGTVVFLGGPLEHIPDLVRRFRMALGLTAKTGIKPTDAHLFTAVGAALLARDDCRNERGCRTSAECSCCDCGADDGSSSFLSLRELERRVLAAGDPEDDLPRLEPLFSSEAELAEFRERHAIAKPERARLFDCRGPLYVGVDAGSTAVKLVAIDGEGRIVYSSSKPTEGDVLATASAMLDSFWAATPKDIYKNPYVHVAHATVTGYGEDILKAGLRFDSGMVETLAHVRAARSLRPDLTFLLDIGGQDMKAIWVRDGRVVNAVLNEACSSGCGSFIEGTAYSLRSNPYRFADEALRAESPVDLGTKCTVFMTSRVRHAQKTGASLADIAAGISYSVVKNALFRIIGMSRLDTLGQSVVVQGGAFASDAVLRAFEKVSGLEVTRPVGAHLMGAYGAALTALMRAADESDARSSLASPDDIAALKPRRLTMRCPGCENACLLSVVDFGSGDPYVTGGRCERGADFANSSTLPGTASGRRRRKAPNVIDLQQKLLSRFGSVESDGPRGEAYLGVMNALSQYESLPFWHTLVRQLGFTVVVPDDGRAVLSGALSDGMKTIPSESVCYPAKIAHMRLHDMLLANAQGVLMPRFERFGRCPVSCDYASALKDSVPAVRDGRLFMLDPKLVDMRPEGIIAHDGDRLALLAAINEFAEHVGVPFVTEGELDKALRVALSAQGDFEEAVSVGNARALSWISNGEGRRGAVLAGRPYHADPALLHGIDGVLADLDFAVLSPLGLEKAAVAQRGASWGEVSDAGWKPARHLMRLAQFAVDQPDLELVCLQSFGCGYDAASLLRVRDVLEAARRPFTALKIDDMADTAHVRIRLRTLAETLDVELADREPGELANTPCASCDDPAPPASSLRECVPFAGVGQADIEKALSFVPSELCYVASALTGYAIAHTEQNPHAELEIPSTCQRCLVDALPYLVERALGRTPDVRWIDCWDVSGFAGDLDLDANSSSQCADVPRVGIIGCSLLCFDGRMNDGIVSFIREQGCEAVLPSPCSVCVEDVRYLDQLEQFRHSGVDHVIYLQSFGCLKGHVGSRGSLHQMASLFPDMPVTVIDYDPEASALNRENRIRLAIAAAKEHAVGRASASSESSGKG